MKTHRIPNEDHEAGEVTWAIEEAISAALRAGNHAVRPVKRATVCGETGELRLTTEEGRRYTIQLWEET